MGKKCFIIGNGPSLQIEDLELIMQYKIPCFGSHRIYKIFDKTKWRPDFYCAQDSKLINENYRELSKMQLRNKYIAVCPSLFYKSINNATYIKINTDDFYPELPNFSSDLHMGIYEGFTVTYMCIQLAVYMGFKEIYLLGVDHSYSIDLNPDGTIKRDESIQDHFSSDDKVTNIPQTYKSTLAYVAARKYSDQHGIKIYNATREGKLDVFERVELKTIMKQL